MENRSLQRKTKITKVFFKIPVFFLIVFVAGFLQCRRMDKQSYMEDIKAFRGLSSAPTCSSNQNGAVIVMYHRFDGRYSDTSVTKELLIRHLEFFRSNHFRIVPLSAVMRALKHGQSLPEKTLAVTVDDAYRSLYEIAHPVFLKYRVPYTVFVNTEGIDKGIKDYMTWRQLRHIAKSGLAVLEAHGHTHAYMIRQMNASQRAVDVKTSVIRLYKETGRLSKYFAYPYGETHNSFIRELKNYRWDIGGRNFQFEAAFTTQSGPAGCSSSLFALPRFALNMRYGKINNLFSHKMKSRHFPIKNFSPSDLALCSGRQKNFSLTAYPGFSLQGLNCFSTNGGNTVKIRNQNHAKIVLNAPFTKGLRQRINCTLSDGQGRVFWFGKEFAILQCK